MKSWHAQKLKDALGFARVFDMHAIKFDRKYGELQDNLIGIAVERVLYKDAKLRLSFKELGSLRDIRRKVFGADYKIFEIEGEGGIIYKQFNTLQGYNAVIGLLGFREDSLTFNSLKKQLEEIANTEDIEVIKERFFPDFTKKEKVKTA